MENKLIKEIGLETVSDHACKSHLANFYASWVYGFCYNKNRGHPQSSSVFYNLDQLEHWPSSSDKLLIKLKLSWLFLA